MWLIGQVTRTDGPDGRRRLVALGVALRRGSDPEYDHIVTVVGYEAGCFIIHDHLAAGPIHVPDHNLNQQTEWRRTGGTTSLAVLDGQF